MRRIVVGAAIVAACVAAAPPTWAQTSPAITVNPNPVEAGADVTIANAPDAASACLPGTGAGAVDAEVGAPEGAAVVVLLDQIDGPDEVLAPASTDSSGNWQVVVQAPEAGQYNVLATCQLNAVTYPAVTLAVTAAAEPPAEPPPVDPAPPAAPQALVPAFTG